MKLILRGRIENSFTAFGRFRRTLAMKIAFSAVVLAVVVAQFSHAVTRRVEEGFSTTVLPARIRAARLFSATASVTGTVVSLFVAPGDVVQAGQELAVIDSPEIRSAIERATLRLNKMQSRMQSTAGQNRQTRVYLEQYNAAVAASKPPCDLAEQADTSKQESMYEHYRARVASVESLANSKGATLTELERSRREELDALQTLQSARERRLRLRQECNAALAQVRVAKLQMDLHRETEVDSYRSEYEAAQAEMNALTEQQRSSRIVAARAGTVLSTMTNVGDRIQAGSALIHLGDLTELSVEVPVDADIAKAVHKGDEVTVRLPTQPPKEIDARISTIILAPGDETSSYLVRVTIPNPDPRTILAGLEGAVGFRHLRARTSWDKFPF